MPTKRFLLTAAPLALLALAGMGLATAQSSSPFAAKKRVQAWEQDTSAPSAPQSWSVPAAQTPSSQYQAPSSYTPAPQYNSAPEYQPPVQYKAPVQTIAAPIPTSPDAPIAMRPRRSTKMETSSSKMPPKTYGGQAPQQAPTYTPQSYATASAPVTSAPSPYTPQYQSQANAAPQRQSDYTYTPPAARVAQATNYGSATPPTGQVVPQNVPTSGSPYAPQSSGRVQAWETQAAPATTAPTYQAPTYQNQGYQAPTYEAPQVPSYTQGYQTQSVPPQNAYSQSSPTQYNPTGYTAGYSQNGYTPNDYQSPQAGAAYPTGPYGQPQQQVRSWTEKLGLDNLTTLLRGKLSFGAAATHRNQPEGQLGPDDGWSNDEIADAEIELEVSAITDGGLEYGIALGGRAQYDAYRRGFGGQLPDCPAGTDGCSGTTTGLRGYTSGFYSGGEDITRDSQMALESAHLFLRSAYGDVTLGRDDGTAYLFSLGAPTLLAVGASNSPVDYTGYDSVKTVNDASGFAEKITYTSPRLLGDQIGFGLQFGASYAIDGDVCGVDYCNGESISGILQPEIEDIFEAGLALDRTFDNGLRAELTGTYASGSEKSGGADFDNLESFGAGLEFEYGKWTLGSSYLKSNNGLLDGDYTAYDAGLTWKPGALGFTLGYGHAEDDNVGLTSNQGTFGVTYDFNKFTLGTGVQYVNRNVNGVESGLPVTLDQKATSVFVQGGFKF